MKIQTYNIKNNQSNSSKREINNDRSNAKIGLEDNNRGMGSQPAPKKSKLKFIFIIIGIILVIAIAAILSVYFIKKNEKKEEETVENLDEDKNYITATYKVKEGQEIKAFNPSSIGLNEDDYSIYEIEEGSNTLRRLKEKDKKKGHVDSEKNGLMKVKIKFHKNLTSLDYIFESCEDLINIDMSHVETQNITSMIYAFTGCIKMEKINLTSLNTSAVKLMDFLFAGCNSLIDINGLETLNTFSLKKTAGMFLDCNSLVFANLSSFQINNVEEQNGMFINNPSLKVVDLSNCSDANQIFSPEENFDIVIKGNEDINVTNLNGSFKIQQEVEIEEINCTIGSEEKCLECSSKKGEKINCKSCNDGYYLPLGNEFTKTKCKKCDEGCNMCYANPGEDLSICVLCDDNYQLFEGKCIKNCEIGENEKCMECGDAKQGFNDRCKKCNPGYYYDINNNKSICQKIDIDNCIEAEMVSHNLMCLKCSKGFMVYENLCFKSCDEGENEKCASCNNNFDYREYCATCNSGYYRNYFNPTKCQSCFESSSYYYNYTFSINSLNFSILNTNEINLKEALQNGSLDNILEKNEDLIIKVKDKTYEITTTYNQKVNKYNDVSIISLEECENILKNYYNIKKNESIIILKVDIYKEGSSVPIVYFEVFNIMTRERLNLEYCRDIKINIMFPITINKIEKSNCKECDLISGKLYCTFCQEGYKLINNTCFKDCDKGCENCYFDGRNNGTCMKCKEEYLLKSFDYYYNFESYCVPCPTGCKFCFDKNNSNFQEKSDVIYGTDYYNYEYYSDHAHSSEESYNNNYDSYSDIAKTDIYYNNEYYSDHAYSSEESYNNNYDSYSDIAKTDIYQNNDYTYDSSYQDFTTYPYYMNYSNSSNNSYINNYTSYHRNRILTENDFNYSCENYTKCENDMNCSNYPNCSNEANCTNYSNCTFAIKIKKYININNYGNISNYTNCSDNLICSNYSKCLNTSFCSYEKSCLNNRTCFTYIYYKNYTNNYPSYSNYSYHNNYTKNSSVPNYYDNKYCTSCIEGYNLLNNYCKKQCDIGKEEKCLKCEANTINRCSSCNPKYYLDELSGTCHKCEENNCLICDNKTCFECENGYELISNKCYKTCEKGKNEKCRECKNIYSNDKGECESCNEGFYLPNDSKDKSKCYSCSFACLSCYGNATTSICTSCKQNYILSKGKCKIDFDFPEEEKCPPPYVLSGDFLYGKMFYRYK